MNSAVFQYMGTVESLARRYDGKRGAEKDDLVQEGLIFVWQSLEKRICPSAEMIDNRMKDYVRWLNRKSAVPYEAMLPIDMVGESNFDPDYFAQLPSRGAEGKVQGRPAEFRNLHGTPPLSADGS
jgi:DNA-directed RNA polymerase specialized sigma24 family protein